VVNKNRRDIEVDLVKGDDRMSNFERLCIFLIVVFCFTPTLFAYDAETQPETERQVLKRAQKELRSGNKELSEATLRKFLTTNTANIEAKLLLSYVLLKQKRNLESFEIALEVAKTNNKNARALSLIGFSYLNIGDFKNAASFFSKANSIDNKESLSWEGSGLIDFYENRISRSLEKLKEASYLNPNEPDFLYTYAQVSARNEDYLEAAAAYRNFIRIAPKNDIGRLDKIRGLISFLEYLGYQSSLYDVGGAKLTTIPVEIVKLRPILKVKIGKNQKEFRFVLDTGSSVTVLSDKTAKEIGVKPVAKGGQASAIGGTGKFDIVYGFLKSIEIGEAKIKNVPVYIRKFHDDAEQVDGFIGLAIISQFLTTLDYQSKTFTMEKRDDTVARKFAENEVILPLRLTTSGFLSGEIFIQGLEVPVYFIVDTGASISVISSQLAATEELSKFVTNDVMRIVGAGGVLDDVPSFLLPKITFGKHSRDNISAIALNLDLINENSGFAQAGILGGNFLKNYKLTFDFKDSKIAFLPNNPK
jgi:tetratricopeptide (TPR) repeat protein